MFIADSLIVKSNEFFLCSYYYYIAKLTRIECTKSPQQFMIEFCIILCLYPIKYQILNQDIGKAEQSTATINATQNYEKPATMR